MSKEEISFPAQMFVKSEVTMKCEQCEQEFEFSVNKDVYINMFTKTFEFKCPHCGARHTLSFGTDLVKENDNV